MVPDASKPVPATVTSLIGLVADTLVSLTDLTAADTGTRSTEPVTGVITSRPEASGVKSRVPPPCCGSMVGSISRPIALAEAVRVMVTFAVSPAPTVTESVDRE